MPPRPTTLEARVLQKAREIMGNDRALARELRLPMPELFAFLRGEDVPPKGVFLRAVDILLEQGDQEQWMGRRPSAGRSEVTGRAE